MIKSAGTYLKDPVRRSVVIVAGLCLLFFCFLLMRGCGGGEEARKGIDKPVDPAPQNRLSEDDWRRHTVGILVEYVDWENSGEGRLKKKSDNGTGVVLNGGYVLTDRHVVDRSLNPTAMENMRRGTNRIDARAIARRVRISHKINSDLPVFVDADIIAIDKEYDLVLLKPRTALKSPLTLAVTELKLKENTGVRFYSSPRNNPGDEDTTANFHHRIDAGTFQISDGPVLPSWSGSPMFLADDPGAGLIGIISLGFPAKSGRTGGVAISSDIIRVFLEKHRRRFRASPAKEFRLVSIKSLRLSKEAMQAGKGGIFDSPYVRVWVYGGFDEHHFGWSASWEGSFSSETGIATIKMEKKRVFWKPYGCPLLIRLIEVDDAGDEDTMDTATLGNRVFPQDARFPFDGEQLTLGRGSTITFRAE